MRRSGPEHDIEAARALAARLGIGAVTPRVLKLAHHTTLKLDPHPIVARVQSSEPVAEAASRMAREAAVAAHLADAGAPTVAPAADPGPHEVDGAVISLWRFVEARPAGDGDAVAAGRALNAVHAGLRGFADLPPFTHAIDRCAAVLADAPAMAALAEADRRFLLERHAALRETLAAAAFAVRPLHGDTHIGNVLMTDSGPLWADLETVCIGPLEWDLVQLPPAGRAVFGPVDEALLALLSELRSLTVAVWCWADADRREAVREAAQYHLARVKRLAGR